MVQPLLLLLASAAAALKGFCAFDTFIVCSSAMHACVSPEKDALCPWLSELQFAQEHFKLKETQGTLDSQKSRAGSAIG